MNSILNSTRAAIPATHSVPAYFTKDSRSWVNGLADASPNSGRYKTEMSAMSYRKVRARVPYASALYAAAVAALLSACSQSGVEPAPNATRTHMSETASDMPEVVITASRERSRANG
jgi:hypothetical protein